MTAATDAPTRPTTTRPARARRHRTPVRPHLSTLASLVAVVTSSWALNPLLAPGRWAALAFASCLVLAWGTAWLRTRVHNPFVPTVLGATVLTYGLAVAYLSPPGEVDLLPGAEALDRLGPLTAETVDVIVSSVAPLEITPGLEAAAIGGICVVYLLVELLSFGVRSPAWSGLALLFLWLPAITIYITVSSWVFVLAGVSFLALLAITSGPPSPDPDERRRKVEILTIWCIVVTVVAVALVPLVTRLPGWGANPLPHLGSGGPGAVILGSELSMSDSLGSQSPEVALRYTLTAESIGPLRLRTMHEFDGETWRLDEGLEPREIAGADDVLWPVPVARAHLDDTSSRADVEIVNLREDRIPIPVTPRTLDSPGVWTYDPTRDEVVRSRPTVAGDRYSVTTSPTALTPEILRTLGHGAPDRAEKYLEVPATAHAADIARRAREVTADAESAYDQALLLQTYLRSRPFEYQTTVPAGATSDAVWDFLETGRGYCVQFATAMTIMARTLGIPARMGVGFLPGSAVPGSPRTFEVRGDRAHTWPELHFEDVGWVRFEPTPAEQSGLPPAYADPFSNVGPGASPEPEVPESTPTPVATPTPTTNPSSRPGTSGSLGGTLGGIPWTVLAATVLATLTAAAVVIVVVVRRRRKQAAELTPEAAWALVRDRVAQLGITWPDSATPRQAGEALARHAARRRGSPLETEAAAALRLLVRSVEESAYSPRPVDVPAAELEAAVATLVAGTTGVAATRQRELNGSARR